MLSSLFLAAAEDGADAGKAIALPDHYFPKNDPASQPENRWRSHAHLLFGNWINEIYQTPEVLQRFIDRRTHVRIHSLLQQPSCDFDLIVIGAHVQQRCSF